MPLMPETRKALSDFEANNKQRLGTHNSSRLEQGRKGRVVIEEPYDSVKHRNVRPNVRETTRERLTGQRHVQHRLPPKTFDLNVVVYRDPTDRADPAWITAAKRRMERQMVDAIDEAQTGFGDRTFVYAIGDTKDAERDYARHEVEVLRGTEDSRISAKEAAAISMDGLTIVLGTGRNLPLHESTSEQDYLVMLMTQHLFELEMQPNTGIYTTGEHEPRFVDTANEQQLVARNATLANRRAFTIERFEQAGIGVAEVVFDPRNNPQFGFNITAADTSLASAISTFNR